MSIRNSRPLMRDIILVDHKWKVASLLVSPRWGGVGGGGGGGSF